LPGGGLKHGEPTVSGAARELYEELGLKAVKVMRLRDCDFKGAVSNHKVCVIEAVGEPRLRGHELDKFIWWDMRTPIPCYVHVKNIIPRILESLNHRE
jgi:8-oxo-dGTP pyrophosphatase MutT (NUDIX family)